MRRSRRGRARRSTHARAPEHTRSCGRSFQQKSAAILDLFPCCLLVVVILAQALVVAGADEKIPVTFVRNHMVHHRGPCAVALGRAHPAERLPCQLVRAEPSGPDGLGIPAVVSGAVPSLPGCWPVLVAPSLPGQLWASRASAWSQRFRCHRAVTSVGKTKTPEPANPRRDNHWLRRSTLWPLAISTWTRDLQSRQ